MPEESKPVEEGTPERTFSIVRKGYDPDEVEVHLAEYDLAFCDLEEYAARLKHDLSDARIEIVKLKAAEQESVDRAMRAVFDAKERILKQARLRASEIENQARAGAGSAGAAVAAEPSADDRGPDPAQPSLQPDQPAVVVNLESSVREDPSVAAPAEPGEVLHKLTTQAEEIRTQLQNGLAAAVDEIERMQREAEVRATALLEDARSEADQLRSAGRSRPPEAPHSDTADPEFAVTLPPEGPIDGTRPERPSRYTRNSAKLPRIGENAGESVLASMNHLRAKLREAEEVVAQVQEPSAS